MLATGFFVGHVPLAPATWACCISIILWYFTRSIPLLYTGIAVVLFALGVVISQRYEKVLGDDPHCVVIDEYACFLLPLYFIPRNILFVVVAFISFRILDILKPPPLRRLEHAPHGWGVMLDDLGAAVYTTIIIMVARIVLHR
ncbi:phosphatidylglycerophosphatase A [candidate division WOR-3 bacterium]|nr:phosphatidylglycerophosphatase A [candidate division WOR-3 bacterium]